MCICGNDLPYEQCCKPYLRGKTALTAEALMRSRYTAYVKRDGAYLHRTWSSTTRPSKADLMQLKMTEWQGLTVLSCTLGQETDVEGEVAFIAQFLEDGQKHFMQENSLFIREKGKWVYLSAK